VISFDLDPFEGMAFNFGDVRGQAGALFPALTPFTKMAS
jgi:hypothetical protein